MAQKNQSHDSALHAHIGQRLRLIRNMRSMTQRECATALGVETHVYQHMERYGGNLSVSLMYQMSEIFYVPVSFFYDQYEEAPVQQKADAGHTISAGPTAEGPHPQQPQKSAAAESFDFGLIRTMMACTSPQAHAAARALVFKQR